MLDLAPNNTAEIFAKLSGHDIAVIYEIFSSSNWAPLFEKGLITRVEFRNEVNKALNTRLTNEEIDEAWNAMLGDLPQDRFLLLSGLRTRFQTFILSNTNEIHVDAFTDTVAQVAQGDLIDEHFDKIYYSHEMGMRKPDLEIFEFVLKSNNLKPDTTLFIDDMLPNIEAAQECGIKTVHMKNQHSLFELFG